VKIAEFLTYLEGVKVTPTGYVGCCPAHDDRHQSLPVKETDDRLLIHCRAGCRTCDVLAALGLGFSDLFLNNGQPKGTTHRNGPSQPEPVPRWYWNWRSQCAELERAIEAKRERHEAILGATQGMDINGLTVSEFDELMEYVGSAYTWLEQCERLDEMLFDLQQTLRAEEQAQRIKARKAEA